MNVQEAESNLRYELKMNDMILMQSQKQTLIECISSILGIDNIKLHEKICNELKRGIEEYTLPRKLGFIVKDNSIIDDYRKYPQLHNFTKITLEMVSLIFKTKLTLFNLNNAGALIGLIVNEKGYQQQIKIGRVNNNFYEVKDVLYSHNSSAKHDPSSSSQSYKYYQAFDIDPLPASKFQIKTNEGLSKSFTQIPVTPLLKKGVSLCEERPKQIDASLVLAVPNIAQKSKQFDEMSLQNAVDEMDLYSAQKLTESIKFGTKDDLTQSLSIPKVTTQQPQQQPVPPQQSPQEQGVPADPNQPDNSGYYGYYSAHMYYPFNVMGQGSTRAQNFNGNFSNNLTGSVSLSPGKSNVIRKQVSSTLQINQNQRYTGRLKFFDEGKNYGFIIMDADESDIFVHCDDLQKAGINKDRIRTYKQSEGVIRFSFKVMSYFGKYKESRKAVDLIILDDGLGMPSLYT